MTAEKILIWYIGESIYEDWQFGARTEFVNGVNTVVAGTEFDFSDYDAKLEVRAEPDATVQVTLESPTTIIDTNFDTGIVRLRGGSTLLDNVTPGTYLYDLRMESNDRTLYPLQGKVMIKRRITQP